MARTKGAKDKTARKSTYRNHKSKWQRAAGRAEAKWNSAIAKYGASGRKSKGWKGDKSGHSKAAKKAWETRHSRYGKSGRKNGKKSAPENTAPKTRKGKRAAARANQHRRTKKS